MRTTSILGDEGGSVLIMVIVAMVIVAGIGTAILTTTPTTMFTQIGSADTFNGYFLTEAGKEFAVQQIEKDTSTNHVDSCTNLNTGGCSGTPKTFSLPNDAGSFSLRLALNSSNGTLIVIGMPNGRTDRQTTFEFDLL